MRLYTRILVGIAATVLLSASIALLLATGMLVRSHALGVRRTVQDVAESVARMPEIQAGLAKSPFDGVVQDRAQRFLDSFTGIDAIVVCDRGGMIYSHRNPFHLGLITDDPAILAALASRDNAPVMDSGPKGESVRAIMPVSDFDRRLGIVSVTAGPGEVHDGRRRVFLASAIFAAVGLAIGLVGATLLTRMIKKRLLGLEPEELSKLYSEHTGMVEALHEGLFAVDGHGRIRMTNAAARRLLGLAKSGTAGLELERLLPGVPVGEVMASPVPLFGFEHGVDGRTLIVNLVPIAEEGKVVGAVGTLQDKTQVVRMAEELTGIRQLVATLRASSHEFSNKLHVILGLLELKEVEKAKEYILGTRERHLDLNRRLLDAFRDPAIAGLMLGKFSAAEEQGVRLDITPGSRVTEDPDPARTQELITILGNLVDNALEAARKGAGRDGKVTVDILSKSGMIILEVRNNGEQIPPDQRDAIFAPGVSSRGKGRGTGLALVRQAVRTLGGGIDVSSRFGETVFTIAVPAADKGEEQ